MLKDGRGGRLILNTPLIQADLALADIGWDDIVFDNSGDLPRFIRISRLPTNNEHRAAKFTRKIVLRERGDNAIFLRLTQEDGTRAWTSPIYLFR